MNAFTFLSFVAAAAAPIAAQTTPPPVPAATPRAAAYALIEGNWTVDLRLKLDDPVYTKPMMLHIAADRTVTGSFYDSDILAGHAGTAQGRSCIAFRTTDGSGFYHTSACLIGQNMIGQTWAEGRNFVLPWTATRN